MKKPLLMLLLFICFGNILSAQSKATATAKKTQATKAKKKHFDGV